VELQAPTPEFVPCQRGDIFSSALDIMATQQSMFEDDGSSRQPSAQLDSLSSTLHAATDATIATQVRPSTKAVEMTCAVM